jgi:hypothetical protein
MPLSRRVTERRGRRLTLKSEDLLFRPLLKTALPVRFECADKTVSPKTGWDARRPSARLDYCVLDAFVSEGVELEKEFVRDCLPEDMVGLRQADLLDATAGPHLRRRGIGSSHLSRGSGDLRDQLRESVREIPGTAWFHGTADVISYRQFQNTYPRSWEAPNSQFILRRRAARQRRR